MAPPPTAVSGELKCKKRNGRELAEDSCVAAANAAAAGGGGGGGQVRKVSKRKRSQSHNNNNNNKNDGSIRRKLQKAGVDVPEIPGLPIRIVPLHIHALKTARKYFQNEAANRTVPPHDIEEQQQERQDDDKEAGSSADAPSSGVVQSILNRLEQSERDGCNQLSDVQRQQSLERLHRYQDAVKTWLSEIHREVRDEASSRVPTRIRIQESSNGTGGRGNGNGGAGAVNNNNNNSNDNINLHGNGDDNCRNTGNQKRIIITTNKKQGTVALAAWKHCWELTLSENGGKSSSSGSTVIRRLCMRRAALHLAGNLLHRAADCRRCLLEEGCQHYLLSWMDGMVKSTAIPDGGGGGGEDDGGGGGGAAAGMLQARLLKREAYMLLRLLQSAGYGDLYPTLAVALRRLGQMCPDAAVVAVPEAASPLLLSSGTGGIIRCSSFTAANAAANGGGAHWLRRQRDMALKHCLEEKIAAEKWIKRAHACIDALVPRMASLDSAPAIKPKVDNDNNNNNRARNRMKGEKEESAGAGNGTAEQQDDADSDDDIIGWEDCSGEFDIPPQIDDDNRATLKEEEDPLHADAVERTLAAMKAAGGLQAGELEIDFRKKEEDGLVIAMPTDEEKSKIIAARNRLEKCYRVLSRRHLTRLSDWVDGLVKADGLVAVSSSSSSSLVSMTHLMVQRRKETLRLVEDIKRDVSTVLVSCNRLLCPEPAPAATRGTQSALPPSRPHSAQHRTSIGVNLSGVSRHRNLDASLERRRNTKGLSASKIRSNRIQIKFHKN